MIWKTIDNAKDYPGARTLKVDLNLFLKEAGTVAHQASWDGHSVFVKVKDNKGNVLSEMAVTSPVIPGTGMNYNSGGEYYNAFPVLLTTPIDESMSPLRIEVTTDLAS